MTSGIFHWTFKPLSPFTVWILWKKVLFLWLLLRFRTLEFELDNSIKEETSNDVEIQVLDIFNSYVGIYRLSVYKPVLCLQSWFFISKLGAIPSSGTIMQKLIIFISSYYFSQGTLPKLRKLLHLFWNCDRDSFFWVNLSRFDLKTETECSLWYVFL
jgi:hypothetical protein